MLIILLLYYHILIILINLKTEQSKTPPPDNNRRCELGLKTRRNPKSSIIQKVFFRIKNTVQGCTDRFRIHTYTCTHILAYPWSPFYFSFLVRTRKVSHMILQVCATLNNLSMEIINKYNTLIKY